MTEKRKLLFVTEEAPFPPNSGGKIRDHCLLRLLSLYFEVEVFSFFSELPHSDLPGVRLKLIARGRRNFFFRILSQFRPYVANGYSVALDRAIRSAAEPGRILWLSRLVLGKYLELGNSLGFHTILDEHNVESSLPGLSRLKGYEKRYCLAARDVIAVSEEDARLLRTLAPTAQVTVLPNTVDFPTYAQARATLGDRFLFTGSLNYFPNFEGLDWFLKKVHPHLTQSLKDRLLIAGANPSPDLIEKILEARIELQTNPLSMSPIMARSAAVFVPLLSGSGTRIKILEALASGRPVISTSKGAEGLPAGESEGLLIADDPEDFAQRMVQIESDPELSKKLRANALRTAESRHHWRNLASSFESFIENRVDSR